MKIIFCLLVPLASSVSCTNITTLGHVAAYDINAVIKGDPVAPLSLNAGFESRSFVAVPPEDPLKPKHLLRTGSYHEGDVLPTISKLKIQAIGDNSALGNTAFDFVSSGATGDAAIAAAGGDLTKISDEIPALENEEKAKNLGKEIDEISKKSSSIKRTSVPNQIE